jgi:flagellar hook-basal body complex protein FliE
MEAISREMASGNQVRLETSNKLHFNDEGKHPEKANEPKDPFSKVLFDAVNESNSLQQKSDELEETMVLHPEQVDIHEVMIASEKARLSISFFKSITEKAVRAYNDILMIR